MLGGGEGGGGGNLEVIVVRVCEPEFRNPPHSYTWPLKKTGPLVYLIVWNVDQFIYCLWFLYPFIGGSSQFIEYKENKQPRKISQRKYTHIPGCQKSGAYHIRIKKNRVSHLLFVEKRGPVMYLAALKKGAIRHAHPYYAIYRKLHPPTPTTPPPPCTPVISYSIN